MARPLTLLLPILPGTSAGMLAIALCYYGPALDEALSSIGTVHYARTLVFDRSAPNLQPSLRSEGPFVVGVITSYDGDFHQYVQDFVSQVGTIFDALLQFVVGGKEVTPVAEHVAAFERLILANDVSQMQPKLFQAYTATVQEVLASLPPLETAAHG